MKEFSWTLEYTLSLSFPVFIDLFSLIRRVRFDAAIDEFFIPYSAAKYGGKCSKSLFDGRGNLFRDSLDEKTEEKCSPDQVKKALRKLRAINKAREKE